jgi:predicted house-cleaning noncanonical NTP pyrophosphatase (MazG superfamily)
MKLVRDHIPEIIEEAGEWCLTRVVNGTDEHMAFLKEKIVEESQEFIDNPSYEEAADMLEVVKAFCYFNNLEFDAVINIARNKQDTHGGFHNGIILQKVGKE